MIEPRLCHSNVAPWSKPNLINYLGGISVEVQLVMTTYGPFKAENDVGYGSKRLFGNYRQLSVPYATCIKLSKIGIYINCRMPR
jgi:hypothetical protein